MKPFEFGLLEAHVQMINVRTEKHGEEDKLAVDVFIRLMMGDVGAEWDGVLEALVEVRDSGSGESINDFIEQCAANLLKLPFSAAYEGYKVVFKSAWTGPKSVPGQGTIHATLTEAKINKFVMDVEDFGITLRVQAETDSETIGRLSDLIGHRIGVETIVQQIPLHLVAQSEPAPAEAATAEDE